MNNQTNSPLSRNQVVIAQNQHGEGPGVKPERILKIEFVKTLLIENSSDDLSDSVFRHRKFIYFTIIAIDGPGDIGLIIR